MDKLKLRNAMKKKKPNFERQDTNIKRNKRKFGASWNKPRGIHSKMRRCMRGKKTLPAVGFRSPFDVRGLLRSGFESVVVHNLIELKKVDTKKQVALLAAGLGMRRRVEILNKAVELKIPVYNVKEPEKFVEEAKKNVEERKKLSEVRKKSKDKKQSEKEAKAKEKEAKEKETKKEEAKPAKESKESKEKESESKESEKKTEGAKQ